MEDEEGVSEEEEEEDNENDSRCHAVLTALPCAPKKIAGDVKGAARGLCRSRRRRKDAEAAMTAAV